MDNETIIMGVDPGTLITGYGIISTTNREHRALDYGCIRPPRKMELNQRYLIIYNGIVSLIKKYNPSAISVETQFVNKNVQSAIKLGMARGVIILAATLNNIPVFEYAPKKAKLSVVGNGKASKSQIQKMTQMLLKLSKIPTPEDAADALALAICHAHQNFLNLRK